MKNFLATTRENSAYNLWRQMYLRTMENTEDEDTLTSLALMNTEQNQFTEDGNLAFVMEFREIKMV